MKRNLLGMTRNELESFAVSLGESTYRGGQLFQWLYGKGITEFAAMTDLGRAIRASLEERATITGVTLIKRQESAVDGTAKFLFGLPRGEHIETVLIPPASSFVSRNAAEDEQQRLTLCVSTQVGCALACAFCATGTMGFARNLTAGEIVDQVLQVRRATGRRITNVVFMGMGEPMLNYDNVMTAADILTGGMNIAARRITISTAGWVEGIRRMGEERRRQKLAVSLHGASEETRALLMPVSRRYTLASLLGTLSEYFARTTMRVTYEYIFFDGINDSAAEVTRLIRLARRVPSKINVIPFHSIAFTGVGGFGSTLRPSPRTAEIVERLRAAHLTVMVRSNAGEDIDAACGQLVVREAIAKRRRYTLPLQRELS